MKNIAKVNGIHIWYEEFGNTSNETVLLIMGANANCKQWGQEFIDQLVANNFHVVRFDNRDVGKSTWIGKEPALRKLLKFLPSFILKPIVNSIFGLAIDAEGKFKFSKASIFRISKKMAHCHVRQHQYIYKKKASERKGYL